MKLKGKQLRFGRLFEVDVAAPGDDWTTKYVFAPTVRSAARRATKDMGGRLVADKIMPSSLSIQPRTGPQRGLNTRGLILVWPAQLRGKKR